MKKKLTNILLILVSAFAFTSCGDSKEAVIDDAVSLMKESAEAVTSGDTDELKKIEEKAKKLSERAKALGFDLEDPSTLPDDLKQKFAEGAQAASQDVMEQAKAKAKEAIDNIGK